MCGADIRRDTTTVQVSSALLMAPVDFAEAWRTLAVAAPDGRNDPIANVSSVTSTGVPGIVVML